MNFASKSFQLIFPFVPSPENRYSFKKSAHFILLIASGFLLSRNSKRIVCRRGYPSESGSYLFLPLSHRIFISMGSLPFVQRGRIFLIFRNRSNLIRAVLNELMKNSPSSRHLSSNIHSYEITVIISNARG